MTREELEFRISEYLDGTLSSADRTALEQRLAVDPEARNLLAEYRSVDRILRSALPLPPIDYNALAGRISQGVAADDTGARTGVLFSFKWMRRAAGIAVAASVLIAGSLWIHHGHKGNRVMLVEVTGPEVATVQPVEEIEIGPSPAIREQAPLGVQEAIVTPPQRLIIAGAAPIDSSGDIWSY